MLSFIFLITLTMSVDCCPTGGDTFWVELGDSCYSISREPMDWGTAQEVGNILYIFIFKKKNILVLLGPGRLPGRDHVGRGGNAAGHFSH